VSEPLLNIKRVVKLFSIARQPASERTVWTRINNNPEIIARRPIGLKQVGFVRSEVQQLIAAIKEGRAK
jgi:predicted DNA-binding transcriptional regulator AlpA